ncbi:nucleotide-binding protein [Sinomonas gamaensis]|uniref:nucleotide-binding protein n=1 Tax=Sinomonas gamaensis TaxID=2565624 RepID=UPI0014864571|nr:nucleotide-binding protein [Sinomonas gamaensis]
MTVPSSPARLFIGSSSEGRDLARHLQTELAGSCEVERWDQNVFEPSGYTLDSLLRIAASVDFAVLVATPDDTTVSRGVTTPSARDNIILEFGLFAGVLGRERVYLLATGELKLPTDVLGLTRLAYHPPAGENTRAAVTAAALQIEERIRSLGRVNRIDEPSARNAPNAALEQELAIVCANAVAQGWVVKANSATTLRLRSPRGKTHTLTKGQPELTRVELRRFAAELRAAGLRVNHSVRRPVTESPF